MSAMEGNAVSELLRNAFVDNEETAAIPKEGI